MSLNRSQIDTPALCLDLNLFENNVRTMVDVCRKHQVNWRPHAKCHKSPVIAQKLVESGAIGVTCATISEAEIMAEAGIEDLLIANLLTGKRKIERLLALSKGRCRPIVCIDHPEQASAISEACSAAGKSIRVLVELDIGLNRVGVADVQQALELARLADKLPGIELAGVMAYEGHLLRIPDLSEKESAIRSALKLATDCRDQFVSSGLACPIVSCGGTGSYPIAVAQPGITEIQAGGAIFMDAFYREACQIDQLDQALTVLATIVSLPAPNRAVMDAGRKAIDIAIAQPQVRSHYGVEIDWLSAEHGVLKVDPERAELKLGDTIEIVPGYADLTNNLHQQFYAFRGEHLEQVIAIHH